MNNVRIFLKFRYQNMFLVFLYKIIPEKNLWQHEGCFKINGKHSVHQFRYYRFQMNVLLLL